MLTAQQYQHWLAVATRHARRRGEAEDLLHSALLAAIAVGRRNLDDPAAAAWFAGVIRNTATMDARTAARRHKRETTRTAPENDDPEPADELQAWLGAISQLPRSSRSVAILALHGLNRGEIASVLSLTDTTLRQRLTSIRRAWNDLDPTRRPNGAPRVRSTFGTQLEVGLLRRSLIDALQIEGDLGTHDPDGHLIVLTRKGSQNRIRRQRDGA